MVLILSQFTDFIILLNFLVLLLESVLVSQLLLPVEGDARIGLICLVLKQLLSSITLVVVVNLLTVGGPFINMLDMVALIDLLLNCRVVATALLLVLSSLLLDLCDVLRSLVAQRPRLYWVLRPRILEACR